MHKVVNQVCKFFTSTKITEKNANSVGSTPHIKCKKKIALQIQEGKKQKANLQIEFLLDMY